MKFFDKSLIGKRFDRWTVISIDYEKSEQRHQTFYVCECDCGTIRSVRRSSLLNGESSSCGCMRSDRARTKLLGERFGRLVVNNFSHVDNRGQMFWECICDCGQTAIVCGSNLTSGQTRSCGCYQRDTAAERANKHGLARDRIYNIWNEMVRRCENTKCGCYDYYGGRGIYVCEEWYDVRNFYEWAINNGYEDGLTIDRINNDDGYYPENCRWVDRRYQANNRRTNHFITYCNVRHTISEWARLFDIPQATLHKRVTHNNISDFADYFGIIDLNWHDG